MKDFGRWFQDQSLRQPAEVDMLPDGLWERKGKIMAHCRSCENAYEIFCDPKEFSDEYSYCCRSDRCVP